MIVLESGPKRSALSSISNAVCNDLFRVANAFIIRYSSISEGGGRIIWPVNELWLCFESLHRVFGAK